MMEELSQRVEPQALVEDEEEEEVRSLNNMASLETTILAKVPQFYNKMLLYGSEILEENSTR